MVEKPLLYFLIIAIILPNIVFFIKSLRVIILHKNKKFILTTFLMVMYFIFVGHYASNNHPYTGGVMYIGSIAIILIITKIFYYIKTKNNHDIY